MVCNLLPLLDIFAQGNRRHWMRRYIKQKSAGCKFKEMGVGGKTFMRKTLSTIFIISFALAAMAVPRSHAQDTTIKALRVNGAVMGSDEVQMWAEAFMQVNPDIRVVVTGSSAGKGFNDLFEGSADVAMASRVISPDEQKKAATKGLKLENKLIGHSGMAVMTSPKNPINELTLDQLRRIFTGEYTNWKQVGGPDAPIRSLTRKVPESGGAVFFMEEVLHNQPYGPSAVMADSWTAIVKVCTTANDLPIGISPALGAKGAIKVLGIKKDENAPAVLPSAETLKARSYPIINSIRLYWDSQSQDDRIKKFVDFCASKGLQSNQRVTESKQQKS
jgi:phosphate transport system substrate-binding protein